MYHCSAHVCPFLFLLPSIAMFEIDSNGTIVPIMPLKRLFEKKNERNRRNQSKNGLCLSKCGSCGHNFCNCKNITLVKCKWSALAVPYLQYKYNCRVPCNQFIFSVYFREFLCIFFEIKLTECIEV